MLKLCPMPDKPLWVGRLDQVVAELEAFPHPWVDRAAIERLLGVGRRRAQQILQPCVAHQIGASGVADRDALIERLKALARGEVAHYERQRRRKLAQAIEKLRREWVETPHVVVEAPEKIVQQELDDLPPGVHVRPGSVTVEFGSVQEGLEKLLALAMAIGNDFDRFERLTQTEPRKG